MPILPLNLPAVLGVMRYPKSNEQDLARAYSAQLLGKSLSFCEETGRNLPHATLLRLVKDSGAALNDEKKRLLNGTMAGDTFKILFALSNTTPDRASWENAVSIIGVHAGPNKVSGSRASIMKAKSDFHTVAHLWAAYQIRKGNEFYKGLEPPFRDDPDVGYSGYDDFQSFLAEAESLRRWGQSWQRKAAKAEPPLPKDAWRVPDGWEPPKRKPGWPQIVAIKTITLDEVDLDRLHQSARSPGRPRKSP